MNYRVVGFEVETRSVDFSSMSINDDKTCSIPSDAKQQAIPAEGNTQLLFAYSVEWHQSSVRWASRWDSYLAMSDVQIHWFSIINSVVVIFFLSGV